MEVCRGESLQFFGSTNVVLVAKPSLVMRRGKAFISVLEKGFHKIFFLNIHQIIDNDQHQYSESQGL
jgi:hypothetical protein